MKQPNRSTGAGATALAVAAFLAIAGSASGSIIDLLGPAGDYAILGEPGATIHLSSGPLRVYGNVGVANGAQLNFDGGGQIVGRVDYASGATLNTGNSIITGGTQQVNFSPISQGIQNVVNYAGSLTPTQSFSSITNAMTLNSTGAVNVISVPDIHLSGGNLTLNGSASDRFIFQISGGFELSGNTNIVLTGGLTASNVLWDFTGSSGHVQTSGKSDTAGIFLAPLLPIQINGGTQNSEFISGVGISGQSNPIFNQPINPPTPPSVPEPGTLLPLLLVLGAAIGGPYLRRTFA